MFDLKRDGFERVFIALHGRYGEDGTVQGALELMGIPYTGSGVMASALAWTRCARRWCGSPAACRRRAGRCCGPTATGRAWPRGSGLPLIVKPAREGSTLGSDQGCAEREELPAAFAAARGFDPLVLAEEFVAGEELTAGFVGEQALPLIRIEAPEGRYDYQNKYFSDETRYFCPCGLAAEEERAIQDVVMRSAQALDCSGWGRADLIRRADGSICAAGDEHLAGHDRPQPGADGGEGGRHGFRALVLRILELAHVG